MIVSTHYSKTYFPNLNALRLFAFLAVFVSHSFGTFNTQILANPLFLYFIRLTKLGVLGVNFFFILSSFLISWILLEETNFTGKIHIKNFYIKRILRIWPLYFLVVLVGIVILPLIKNFIGDTMETNANPFYYLFFIVNFGILSDGIPYLPVLAILWTISVEEQFYICWPILHNLLKSNIYIGSILIIIGSLIFRAFFIQDGATIYFHTLSIMSDVGIGSLLAYISFKKNVLFQMLASISKKYIIVFYLLLTALILFYNKLPHSETSNIFERLIWGIIFSLIIFEQCFSSHSILKAGINKWVNYLGKISYGLYCYHALANLIIWQLIKYGWMQDDWLTVLFYYPILSLLLTILMSHISYQFYEKYFLRLKSKFDYSLSN